MDWGLLLINAIVTHSFFFRSCSLNPFFNMSTPFDDVTSASLNFPILTALQTSINAFPIAKVTTPAVPAEITPPAMEPRPGISLGKFEAIVFPTSVAPPALKAAIAKAFKPSFFMLISKTPQIVDIKTTCCATNMGASAKGIGTAQVVAVVATATATALSAFSIICFSSKYLNSSLNSISDLSLVIHSPSTLQ